MWSTQRYSLTSTWICSNYRSILHLGPLGYEPCAHRSQSLASLRNHLTNLSTMPTPITQVWNFSVPIPVWITNFFHIERGLLITFDISISAYRTEKEFNTFTVKISFRRAIEGSLPQNCFTCGPIYTMNLRRSYHLHTEQRFLSYRVTTSGTTMTSPLPELHAVPLPPNPLPKLEDFPKITAFKCCRSLEKSKSPHLRSWSRSLKSSFTTQPQHSLIACQCITTLRSGVNLDKPAFCEGTLTYLQLQRIDQSSNPVHRSVPIRGCRLPATMLPRRPEQGRGGGRRGTVRGGTGRGMPPAHPRAVRNWLENPTFRAQFTWLIPGGRLSKSLDECLGMLIETMTCQNHQNQIRSGWLNCQGSKRGRNTGCSPKANTRTQILNFLIILVVINFALNISILYHLVNNWFL